MKCKLGRKSWLRFEDTQFIKSADPNLIYFFEVHQDRFVLVYGVLEAIDHHGFTIRGINGTAKYQSAYPIIDYLIGYSSGCGCIEDQQKILAMFAYRRHFWSKNLLYPINNSFNFSKNMVAEIVADNTKIISDPKIQALVEEQNMVWESLRELYLGVVQSKLNSQFNKPTEPQLNRPSTMPSLDRNRSKTLKRFHFSKLEKSVKRYFHD